MKRPDVPVNGQSTPISVSDPKFAAAYPMLTEHLADTTWDDGSTRVPSTITLFLEDGLVKLALNDRDSERSLYRSGETLQEALRAIEKALSSSGADWRAWKGRRKK